MSRTILREIVGAKLLARNGSLVFCENCEKIIGSINQSGYRHFNLRFVCTCGVYGHILISKNKSDVDDTKVLSRMPRSLKGVCCCTKCNTPLFSMIDFRLKNYSFFVECICGECFDTKPSFKKRLGETLELFNKRKKQ